jgi:hypothetical protein
VDHSEPFWGLTLIAITKTISISTRRDIAADPTVDKLTRLGLI